MNTAGAQTAEAICERSLCGLLYVGQKRAPAEVPPTWNCRIVYVGQRRAPAEVPLTRESHIFCNIVIEPMP